MLRTCVVLACYFTSLGFSFLSKEDKVECGLVRDLWYWDQGTVRLASASQSWNHCSRGHAQRSSWRIHLQTVSLFFSPFPLCPQSSEYYNRSAFLLLMIPNFIIGMQVGFTLICVWTNNVLQGCQIILGTSVLLDLQSLYSNLSQTQEKRHGTCPFLSPRLKIPCKPGTDSWNDPVGFYTI